MVTRFFSFTFLLWKKLIFIFFRKMAPFNFLGIYEFVVIFSKYDFFLIFLWQIQTIAVLKHCSWFSFRVTSTELYKLNWVHYWCLNSTRGVEADFLLLYSCPLLDYIADSLLAMKVYTKWDHYVDGCKNAS